MALKKPLGKSFEEVLIERGLLTKEKIQELLVKASREMISLEQAILASGLNEEKIIGVKAESLGYEFLDLSACPQPDADLLKHLRPAYAKNYKVLPVKYEDGILTIAMVEPRNFMALDEIVRLYRDVKFRIKDVVVVMTTTKLLFSAIERFYAQVEESDSGKTLSHDTENYRPKIEISHLVAEEATEDSIPIVMLANMIIEDAFKRRASDIHLEPAIDHLRVRYRIDGEMSEVTRVPKDSQDALLSRCKIMSDMRIDERRLPQDGRIDFSKYNPAFMIDLRVSTVPTPLGEDIVMRILDKKSSVLSLNMLGFNEYNMSIYKEALNSPYGMVLHVGPTGSGKTTALYAALKSLDTPHVKIVTAEDPVEYTLGGKIIQSNINAASGYVFAKAIRAFLRHDPDIILIGEIRDAETAKTAVEASLTGHLVFSTLHTNDAVGTVTRLTEMRLEPYLVADSLRLVCAQRLLRKICVNCKMPYAATEENIALSKGDIKPGAVLYKGKGCEVCDGTGYKGRIGIYELLAMNKGLSGLLIKGCTAEALRTAAIKTGMRTLRQDAIEKALDGITTLDEVVSTTLAEK